LWLFVQPTPARFRLPLSDFGMAIGNSASDLPREAFVKNEIQDYYQLRLVGSLFDKAIIDVDRGKVIEIRASRLTPVEMHTVTEFCTALTKENAPLRPSFERRDTPVAAMWYWRSDRDIVLLLMRKSASREGQVEDLCLILADASDRGYFLEAKWAQWSK
jgi:hypothetical protein